ncbi:MAG: methylaspartate mutase subunit E [Deltaproteobacteria bacterium]|nr:methylaspartate mutase subunit E [Deltaproteobacteria bacterium]
MILKNTKQNFDEFMMERSDVLKAWSTGKDVILEEGLAYQKSLDDSRNFASTMKAASRRGDTLIQPRAGVALIDEHISLLKYLENEGGADLLPTTIDAYTRQNRYNEAQSGIEKSYSAGTSLLNGFPAVNHGIAGCRRVIESLKKPVQVRHGTPDARLLAEISLASGFTSFEGGGISYNIPYAKKVPLEKSIEYWKYVDRLVGYYEDNGVSINREPFGPLTGTLVPPFISIVIGIIEGILALRQGVKSITLGYGQGGNLVQDVSAIIALRELADEYFQSEGFTDYHLTTVFHQWMGGFPENEAKAFSVITWGATVGRLAGADKIIVKTPHEAMGIPTREANAQGLLASRQAISMLYEQKLPVGPTYRREIDLIKSEVNSVMNRVLELGAGDIDDGIVPAFKFGVIDVPFAPAVCNYGKLLPMRDNEGFIRVYNWGNTHVSEEIKELHRAKLELRAHSEGRNVCFQMVTDDIYAISKGKLVGRPR